MTPQLNQMARDLLDRMDSDMEQIRREQAARKKIEPLVTKIREAYRRFPQGPPTRLHVSSDIYEQLMESLRDNRTVTGTIFFHNRPVTTVPDLDGFRWVRESHKKTWTTEDSE